jgi:hypothetical protein
MADPGSSKSRKAGSIPLRLYTSVATRITAESAGVLVGSYPPVMCTSMSTKTLLREGLLSTRQEPQQQSCRYESHVHLRDGFPGKIFCRLTGLSDQPSMLIGSRCQHLHRLSHPVIDPSVDAPVPGVRAAATAIIASQHLTKAAPSPQTLRPGVLPVKPTSQLPQVPLGCRLSLVARVQVPSWARVPQRSPLKSVPTPRRPSHQKLRHFAAESLRA